MDRRDRPRLFVGGLSEDEFVLAGTSMTSQQRTRLLGELAKHGSANVPGCSPVSRSKAKEMLHDGTAHGHALTSKQRGMLGIIASGKTPTRLRS